MFCVYILFSEKLQKFYIEQTDNLALRITNHNSENNPNWTNKGKPWNLYLSIPCKTRTRLEKFIKRQKSKAFIVSLKTDPFILESICSKHDC
ncbi:MAG: hypothetical protein JWM14_2024 [Chitinophagaceae bacterium]|nr:hypothetical protein [Chitinophagaceae bacterium]